MSKRRPAAFSKAYGKTSVNLITEIVDGYYYVGDLIVELSHGDMQPLRDGTLWGVSVVDIHGNKTALSKCFVRKENALRYIAQLGGKKP